GAFESVEGIPRDDTVREMDARLTREIRLLSGQMEARISTIIQESSREEQRGVWWMILWSVAALGVAIFMLVMSMRALAPLSELRDRVARIARGDYGAGARVETDDEAGRLARSIDDMAKSLSGREKEIAETGEKLLSVTAELRRANTNEMMLRTMNENIFRSIRLAILALDEHGQVTNANPAAEAMWGIGARESAGRQLAELPGWGAVLRGGEVIERAMIRRESMSLESVRPGGPESPVFDVIVAPLVGESGVLRGALVIGEDTTEKVRTKQQLIQSERLAAIGRLAAQMTHEVRNPLSSIGLNAELLDETLGESQDPEAKRLLGAIQREISRLTEITEEYLRLSRPSHGKPRPVSVNEVLSDVAGFVAVEFMRASVRTALDLGEGLAMVDADPNRLRQVFMNVIRNAFESMPGGGAITIRTMAAPKGVAIEISDTGQGVAAEAMPHLFDLFYSTKETGFGLGLALASQIITEHGGTIACTSEKGKGSTFRIVLPALPGGS
ncbi:MAG: ATP-binding protein, partial [Myxococcota bacterium]